MPNYDVLLLGDYYLDLIFTGLSQMPALGKEVFATGFEMIPGGAFNTALAMHRLGLNVGWAVDFGQDEFSRLVAGQARDAGLDEGLFAWHERPLRHITVAASYPSDRAFISYNDPDPAMPAAMQALASTSARAVCTGGVYSGRLLEAGLLLLRSRRIRVVMDGNSGDDVVLSNPAVRRAVEGTDVFLPNADEARRMTGHGDLETALRELGALCPLVVIKDGGRGAHAITGGHILYEPAIPVTAVDTTGAGDCFNAGFVKAWLDGHPLRECLRWGNVVGGLSTTARGGTARAVTLDEVQHWLDRPR